MIVPMKKAWCWLLRRRRMVTAALLGLIGVVTLVIVAGLIPFSNTPLKTAVERLLRESLPGSLTIDNMTVTLWTGVTLKNIRYSSQDADGGTVVCSIPRVAVSYYLLPLLLKRVIIKKMYLERPELFFNAPVSPLKKASAGAVSFDAFERALETIPYTLVVREISIIDAHAVIARHGRRVAEGKGLNCWLKIGLKRTLTLQGRLAVADLEVLDTWRAVKVKATFQVNGAEAVVDNFHATLYGGALTVKGSADLSAGVLHTLSLSLVDLQLDRWYRASGTAPGDLRGRMDCSLDFMESALAVDSLKGNGWTKLTDVSARNIPLQRNLFVVLVIPMLSRITFERIYADLSLKNGKLSTRQLTGKGTPLDFKGDGRIGLDGAFSGNVEGVFSGDFVRSLPPLVKNSLSPVSGDNDKRSFKCRISGTFNNPHVQIDERIRQRAVNNVFDAISTGLGRLFKK
jgi:hypothetical protein